jgi:hypothetical protein
VIVLACGAVYANALHNPFLFRRSAFDLTFAVNLAIGGRQTFGFHVVNLAIHALAALTLFACCGGPSCGRERCLFRWRPHRRSRATSNERLAGRSSSRSSVR